MAWIDDLPNPNLPYYRENTYRYFYTSEKGKANIRYIMTWLRAKYPQCQYSSMVAMCGCFNGESSINPATVFGFNSYTYLFNNRKRAFGIVQFVPGCKPKDHDESYWQNYHGTGKPIFYYYLGNKGLGSDIYTLYTNTGYATDMRVQLQYICDQNGWKRSTSKTYDPVYNQSYSGTFYDFLHNTSYDVGHRTAWFYAGFVRSGGPSTAEPNYIRYANAIYPIFYNEFGGDTPEPDPDPDPGPDPGPDPEPEPEPEPDYKIKRNFIIVAKSSGLF